MVGSEVTLNVNWPATKETVAGFTRAAFEYEFAKDLEFAQRINDRSNYIRIEGLLYDIGHSGRGMQDFPRVMPLTVPTPTREPSRRGEFPNLVSTLPFPVFFGQINTNIERYIIDVYRKKDERFGPDPDAWQEEIDALKALVGQSKDRLVTVTFESFIDDQEYQIKRVIGQGYQYINNY